MGNVEAILKPDKALMLEHLGLLFGRAMTGRIEITAIRAGEDKAAPRTKFFDVDALEDAADYAADLNSEHMWNVYVGAALRSPDVFPGKAATDEDFHRAWAIHADVDDGHDLAAVRQAYRTLGITPPFIVVTGRTPSTRAQLWWPLDDAIADPDVYRSTLRGVAQTLKTDPAVTAAKQLMRLAGTINWPKKGDRLLEPTEVIRPANAARGFPLEQLHRAFPPTMESLTHGALPEVTVGQGGALGLEEKIMDGREGYAFRLVRAHLIEWIATTGSEPTVDELYQSAAPVYLKKVDLTRPGRGPAFLRDKCAAALRAFHAGQIPFARTLDEAVLAYANRKKEWEPGEPEGDEAQAALPSPIFDPWERYIVPAFPMDILPPVLRRYAEYQAASVGVDPAAAVMAALTACSGAIDQRTLLKMKRTGDWHVRPRLWTMLVGDPSAKKTPIISAAVRALRKYEGQCVAEYQRDLARWKAEDKETRGDEPPRPTRFLFNDITSEKVGDVLSRQDRGALVEHDELSGFIGAMDKYSGGKGSGADRSFWAQAYNGGPKTIDRLQRGEIYVQNLCVSFLAGMQPDRLSEVANLTSDGLLQRFLPVMMRRSAYPVEVESDLPAQRFDDLVTYLIGLKPQTYQMDEGGRLAADEFQRFVFDLEGMEGLGKSFCTFVGKLSGIHGTLALLLHIIEDPQQAVFDPVSERSVRAASRMLREFIIPHALEFYRGTTDGADWSGMRAIASYLLTSDKDRFTASDFTSGVRALRGIGTWDLTQKLSPLVAGGWLAEDTQNGAVKGWLMQPGLRDAMADRRSAELKAKAELLAKFQALRESGQK